MSKEYVLFTHALLFSHGHWTRDPISDYVHEHNPEHIPKLLRLPVSIFDGVDYRDEQSVLHNDWGHILLVMKKAGWRQFFRYMAQCGAVDRKKKLFRVVGAQCLPVLDILDKRPAMYSTVLITAFIVDGNDRTVSFNPAVEPPLDKCTVVFTPPRLEIVEAADKLFNENETPYN